jgi:hypothetical protein
MRDSGRAGTYDSGAIKVATGDLPLRAANYTNLPANPTGGDHVLVGNDASTPLAAPSWTGPRGIAGGKALLLVDSVRLTRECLTHFLATELKDFETISVLHPQQARECGVSPDVVLLNARVSERSSGTLLGDIAMIASATHSAPMLLLSDGEEAAEAAEASDEVAGLFPSRCGVRLLIAAINLVAEGGRFRAPREVSAERRKQ